MKKSLRFSLICILTLFTFLFAVMFVTNINVKAESEISTASFKLLDGAYMRDATPKGIRFEAGISQADKDSLPENATFGMLITLDSYLGNQELTHEADINVVDIPTSVWLSTSASKVGEGYLGYYSTLVGGTENNSTDMESEYYSSIFVARGYINIDGQYIYTPNTVERSIAGVAEMAIEAGAETDYAQEIVEASKKITFNIDNQNGEIIERQVVVGSILNENDIPETPIKEGYAFLGYYKDVECTEEFKFSGILKQNTTIYAGWGNEFTFTENEDGTLTITGYTGNNNDVVIPNEIDGKSVTSIGSKVFYNCSSLESIVLPSSVTSIGEWAFFDCSSLKTVTFGENSQLTSIGSDVFYSCSSLESIVLPSSVTSIGDYAFYNCRSLTYIEIPSSVTSIGGSAFANCSSLKGVYISDIEAWCNISFHDSYSNPLYYAKNLYLNNELVTDLVLPSSVTSIGDYAFYNCSSLTGVYISDIEVWCNIEFSNSTSNPLCYAKNLYLNNELVTDLVLPNTVTEIKSYAFNSCLSLESIEIPSSVTSIGEGAFV